MSDSRAPGIRLRRVALAAALLAAAGAGPQSPRPAARPAARADVGINRPLSTADAERPAPGPPSNPTSHATETVDRPSPPAAGVAADDRPAVIDPMQAARSLQTVALFAAVSFVPAAVLMLTAFVRINVVLLLLRQALGSPQVPGNQVLTALAVLLTALVMRPTGEAVYARAVEPFAEGKLSWSDAYRRASVPLKRWMVAQIEATDHERFLWELYDLSAVAEPGRADPAYAEDFPMQVVAPAFLLSELTTAMLMGFYLYLPFLVIDLVTAAVLSAAGLFLLPPSLVAMPLKLVLFVVADGWLHVAAMLLQSFGPGPPAWEGG